jgi:diguanylate cyclase (GGDEF)-like protein
MSSISKDELEGLSKTSLLKEYHSLRAAHDDMLDRYTALFQLNKLSQECSELTTFFYQVHQIIASLMIAKNFYVVMYDQTLATLKFVYHVDEEDDTPEGLVSYDMFKGSLTHHVIETGNALLATPELINDYVKRGLLNHVGATGMDWLGVPLIHDGFVIGVMAVQSYTEKTRYQEHDKELLTFTAQHIVGAMQRLQDHERLQNAVNSRTRELMEQIRDREKAELLQESLYRISELTSDSNIEASHFYHQVHNIIGQLINASNFFIAKYESDSETVDFVYYVDLAAVNIAKDFQPQKLTDQFLAHVVRTAKTQLLSHEDMMRLYEEGKAKKPQQETYSWLGVPLIHDGHVIGVMVVQSYNADTCYTEQDAELMNFVSHHVSTSIKRREAADYERRAHELLEKQVKLRTVALEEEIRQRKQAEKMLTHNACHDALTGLPNRTVFLDLLNHAIASAKRRRQTNFAVLFLDLDRFKMVNDSLGHHAGDMLLKVVARELQHIVRAKDTVARLGGDEFVILIEDLVNKAEAYEIAERITFTLSQPFTLESQQVFIGTSVGLLFNDERYVDADTMLRDADTAMYYAKDNGKGRYEEFDASMHHKIQEDLVLEADIRDAIAAREFIPYFQPIVHLSSRDIVGFEALARWNSQKRGLVFPNDFIPLAEETKLVMAIDLQILEHSCLQIKDWQDRLGKSDWYVSCNLFCDHFFTHTLADDITHIINKTGLKPEQLRIELTERALLEESDVVLSNMQALKQLGVKLLLDDFGTGYSSLSYLHRFPIDVLKIDRSFIHNAAENSTNVAIIKTIIDLATNLKMATIGEGIEHETDANLLNKMDCIYGQGYYFAKPMMAKDIEKIIV